MSIFSNEKSNILQIWQTTVSLCRQAFTSIWLLAIIVAIFNSIPLIITFLYTNKVVTPNPITIALSLTIPLVIIYITSLLLLILYNFGINQNLTFKDISAYLNKRYLKVALSMIIALALPGIFGSLALVSPKYLLVPLNMMQLFIVTLFILVQPLVLFDNHRVFSSIKHSCQLVWGNWWHTFIASSPLLVINYLMVRMTNQAITSGKWQLIIISCIIATLSYPLFYGCTLVLYNDLKLRKTSGQQPMMAEES